MMRLILHIGQHKTGTKALQYFLSLNAQALQQQGVNYATTFSHSSTHAYQHSHYHWFAQLLNYTQTPTPAQLALFETTFTQHIQAAQAQGSRICVVSAEDLWLMQTAHDLSWDRARLQSAIHIIRTLCERAQLTLEVVLYVRDASEFLKASYGQYIKGESRGTMSFIEFRSKFKDRLDYSAIITLWKSHLPAETLHIRKYSSQRSWDIREDFLKHVLHLAPEGLLFTWPMDAHSRKEAQNKTPGALQLAWLRIKNIIKQYRR